MAKRTETPQPDDAAPETTAERFREFVENLPEEAMVSIALRRFPCRYTPNVADIESLPPPAFQPSLEAMQDDIRRRCGPGKYRMWIRYTEPQTKKPILVSPMFTLPPTEADYLPPQGEPAPVGLESDGNIQETLDRLTRAARIKAQASELSALKAAVDGPPAGGQSVAETLDLLVKFQTAMGGRTDATAEAVKLLAAMRDLLPGAKPTDPLDGLDKMLGIVEKLRAAGAPAGERSTWIEVADLLMTHGAGLVERLAPYLPALLQSGAQAVSTVRSAGPVPPVAPVAPGLGAPAGAPALANPPVPPDRGALNPEAIRASVGGDARKGGRLARFLDLAYLEYETLRERNESPGSQEAEGAYVGLADFLDRHCPGLAGSLLTMPLADRLALWGAWDGRALVAPGFSDYLEAFWSYLRYDQDERADPTEPEAPPPAEAPGRGTP